MKKFFLLTSFLILISCSQPVELATMPMAVSNNAVVAVKIADEDYIYSFGGIDKTKEHSGITLRSFKYQVAQNVWSEIDPLPDTMPKIASAASVVDGLIYIIGGYHVFPDGHEKSSAKVHIYDPGADKYLEDGPDIPTPIDDQVQAVWRDSLIYVVSGWSDSLNVNLVQLYEPNGHWHYATSLPDEYPYKVFGSSGIIINDNIFFMGGAGNRSEGNFPVQNRLRIGNINPDNPLEITWQELESPLAEIYRPGAVAIMGNPCWIGGSQKSYNYNGIAYTKEPVDPLTEGVYYDRENNEIKPAQFAVPPIMDLRGIAQLSNGDLFIVGGMLANQQVSDRIVQITK